MTTTDYSLPLSPGQAAVESLYVGARLDALGRRQQELRDNSYRLRYAPTAVGRTCTCGEVLSSEAYVRQYPYTPDCRLFEWCTRCGYWMEEQG
jgi:hypothetical protein